MVSPFSLHFPHAFGEPQHQSNFRSKPSDFMVDEELGFDLSGQGEHLCVHVKKTGENTSWIAEKLAKFFSVKNVDIGFCGMKDRHAVTTQWFSVYLPGREQLLDAQAFIQQYDLNAEVLHITSHSQKLRRGVHRANAFTITLRDVGDVDDAVSRLEKITEFGVPNYFGEQRFGRQGNNLALAQRWLEGGEQIRNRSKRGLVMSAARSYLFNRLLSERVTQGSWYSPIDGDVLDDRGMPTGPLWGRGRSQATGESLHVENQALKSLASWCDSLEHVGLQQERRTLVIKPDDLHWSVTGRDLQICFSLPAGQFATSILREVSELKNLSMPAQEE